MKKLLTLTAFALFITAFITLKMSIDDLDELTRTIPATQHQIDSLQREIDFRDDMIRHYIEDEKAEMVRYRVEARDK